MSSNYQNFVESNLPSIPNLGKSSVIDRLLVPPGELDEMELDQLTQIVLDAEFTGLVESSTDDFSRAAENLDRVYSTKVFRYLSTPVDRASLLELSDHLSRVAADLFFDRLESLNKRYGSRWKTYLDLVQVALRVEHLEQKTFEAERTLGAAPESWYWIASRVEKCGNVGLEWSTLMEAIKNGEAGDVIGIRAKSGLSMLVTSMRHAGWLRVVAQGRTRKLYLGNRASTKVNEVTLHDRGNIFMERRADPRLLSEVVKAGTCFNQGAFLNFLLLASERHKALKESLPKKLGVSKPNKVREKLLNLCVYVHEQIQLASENNFRFIDRYFELTRKHEHILPRISVKLVDRINGIDQVVDLARNHSNPTKSLVAAINTNTGFDEIIRNGKYLLINDIAKELFAQRYKNPRLRADRVTDYLNSTVLRSTGIITPTQWRALWIGAEREQDFRSAYRSTLIVPITLINSSVSGEFRTLIQDHTNPNRDSRFIDRTIMGFLCFDHVDANYFNESSDVDVGYMFADWLSLFLFVRYMYTTMSSSFERCLPEFDSADFLQGLRKKIDMEFGQGSATCQWMSAGSSMSTRYNEVFPTDALQRAFVAGH